MASDNEIIFSSYDEAESFIKKHEEETGTRYMKRKSRKEHEIDITTLSGHRLLFYDKSMKGPTVSGDCIFLVLGTELRECLYGPKRTVKEKRVPDDHDYRRTRRNVQVSRKMGCEAQIILKTVMKFPEYKLPSVVNSKYHRSQVIQRLQREFSNKTKKVVEVKVKFIGQHRNHLVGQAADFVEPADKTVKDFIKRKVREGVKNVDEMMSRINDLDTARDHRKSNRRYNPSRKTVYNIMYNEINSSKYTNDDQRNTSLYIEEVKNTYKGDNVYFRPASDPENDTGECQSLLFVHQTEFQRNILKKYGKEVALLDATYNTTKFELPLYMLAVRTNAGFVVVGTFIIGRDTKAQIAAALRIIRSWVPFWCPQYFLTDYDLREIGALGEVFEGAMVYLCQFHVIQAWKRWISKNRDLSKTDKETLLKKLKAICNSGSEEVYNEEVKTLQESEVYQKNLKLRGWLETRWFSQHERWVDCYRDQMILRDDTTNGLEVQHRVFKQNFLKRHGFGGTLMDVVKVLVEKYCPSMEMRYKEANIRCMEESKLYSQYVPLFLRNRPKDFVNHCLNRIPPKVGRLESSHITFENAHTCKVKSVDSENMYFVTFEEMRPSCTCPDYRKKHWPCKHILGVMAECPDYGWDFLNKTYTEQQCFNLDYSMLSEGKDKAVEPEEEADLTPSQEEVHEDPAEKEVSCYEERNCCLEVLTEIRNCLYCINDIEILKETKTKFTEINQYLQKKIPRLGSLPVRKLKVQKARKGKKFSSEENIFEQAVFQEEEVGRQDFLIDITNVPAEEVTITDRFSNTEDPYHRVLEEIWECPGSDEPVIQIGPYTLTRNSLHYLKTTLSDEIMDAYLSLMLKESGHLHINCVVGTSIFTGNSSLHGNLRSTDIFMYDNCVCAVNEGGVHWVLMIIQPRKKKIIYINPLGELNETCQTILHHWYNFLSRRCEEGLEASIGEWEIVTVPHSMQSDGLSCGIYVLIFAERFLNGESLLFHWNAEDIITERKKVGVRLLSAGALDQHHAVVEAQLQYVDIEVPDEPREEKKVTEIPTTLRDILRPKKRKRKMSSFVYYTPRKTKRKRYCVCNKPNDGRLYWQCDECSQWFHPACVGMKDDEEPDVFICSSCQGKKDARRSKRIDNKTLTEPSLTVKSSDAQAIEVEDVLQTEEVEVEDITQTEEVEVEDITQTEEVEVEDITQTEEVEVEDIVHTREVEVEDIVQAGEVEAEDITQTEEKKKFSTAEFSEDRNIAGEELSDDEFIPTLEWKTVKKGQRLPAGLEIKMDLETGQNMARLIEGTKAYKMYMEKCKKEESSDVVQVDTYADISEESGDSDEPNEDTFFIDMEIANEHMDAAFTRVESIIQLKNKKEMWMKRHKLFKQHGRVLSKGYGYAVFSIQAMMSVKLALTNKYFTDVTSKIYTKHGRIIGMTDKELLRKFEEDRFLAFVYLNDVLVPEGLAAILENYAGITYLEANKECMETAQRSDVQAQLAGIIASAEKKKELTGRTKKST